MTKSCMNGFEMHRKWKWSCNAWKTTVLNMQISDVLTAVVVVVASSLLREMKSSVEGICIGNRMGTGKIKD